MGAVRVGPKTSEITGLPDLTGVIEGTCTKVDEPKEYAAKIKDWYAEYSKDFCDFRIGINLTREGYDDDYISEVIRCLNK